LIDIAVPRARSLSATERLQRVHRERAAFQLKVAQAACSLRGILRAGVMTLAATAAVLAAVAQTQAPQAGSPPKSGAAQPEKPAGTPPSATVLDKIDVQGVLGREVKGAHGEDMGRIVDVVVDGVLRLRDEPLPAGPSAVARWRVGSRDGSYAALGRGRCHPRRGTFQCGLGGGRHRRCDRRVA
jgi:hypothetical protein